MPHTRVKYTHGTLCWQLISCGSCLHTSKQRVEVGLFLLLRGSFSYEFRESSGESTFFWKVSKGVPRKKNRLFSEKFVPPGHSGLFQSYAHTWFQYLLWSGNWTHTRYSSHTGEVHTRDFWLTALLVVLCLHTLKQRVEVELFLDLQGSFFQRFLDKYAREGHSIYISEVVSMRCTKRCATCPTFWGEVSSQISYLGFRLEGPSGTVLCTNLHRNPTIYMFPRDFVSSRCA